MSAVLCLPASLCVSTAASRGQAPPREHVSNTHFYLSIGLTKKGWQDILTYKTKHQTLEVVWTPDPPTD